MNYVYSKVAYRSIMTDVHCPVLLFNKEQTENSIEQIPFFNVLQNDLHYTYTECDDRGARWRTQVPKQPEQCSPTTVEAPVRAVDCGKYMSKWLDGIKQILFPW